MSIATADAAKKHNAYGQKHYTVESPHFRLHYHRGLDHLVPRVADKLEELYSIYTETYHIKLPQKTDVVLYESEIPDAFAYPNFNFIYVGVHDYEFNLRGSSDWFDDAVTHEYAHVVSIQTGLKFPPSVPGIQAGFFTHPNAATRFEGLHIFPTETMPIWFLEGIAQYESGRRGADRWDSHRDMIMRTLTLSGNLLSWPHMQVFAGRGDDFEKTYNHGFSLVMYISETYGYDKVVSILRENARVTRLSFDGAVKAVLGISAKQLYDDWRKSLEVKYKDQIKAIGKQVYGRKISEEGYDNGYPAWSPSGGKIYFISNAENDYSLRDLYSYNMSDTVEKKNKVKYELPITSNFDIHDESGKIAFVSMRSRKSHRPPRMGGQRTFDLYIDTLPPDKPKFFGKKTRKQVTEAKSVFAASWAPSGDKLAGAIRKFDRFYLAIIDTSGKNIRIVYPEVRDVNEFFGSSEIPKNADSIGFGTIFSLAWSPSGKDIAVDFIDGDRRMIGVYDTLQKSFSILDVGGPYDMRNPAYNKDGSAIYFSSDKGGVFNIYRYIFESGSLEKLTNVSGGAFHPAPSRDEKKLAYTGYDPNGYGIYLIDTLKALRSTVIPASDAMAARPDKEETQYSVQLSNRADYSHFPKQWLVVPTLLAEQIMTSADNENKGVTNVKAGVVLNFMDPLAWSDVGIEGGAFLLVDLTRITRFIDFDAGLISPYASYDAGVFVSSRTLPVTIDADLMVRGIAGEDWFYEESEEKMVKMPYKIQLTNALLGASHPLWGMLNTHLFLGLDRYDVAMDLDTYGQGIFNYNLSKGYRIGAMTWFNMQARNSRSNISPTGLAGKLQYNLWQQHSLKEENSFSWDGIPKEQYDDYLFHLIDGRLLFGMPSPIYSNHDLHFTFSGSYLKPAGDQNVPSFYLPVAIVPGYSYYYKDTKINDDGKEMTYDTVLITGRAVLSGQASYRFPIWPGRIDKKLGFVYFDMLYGALNFSAGAGFGNPKEALDWERSDWLFSYGAETRLEAISFNNYPLSVSFRWDYGADKAKAETFVDNREIILGGHRFAFSLGFSFDNWGMVSVVDYFSPARRKNDPAHQIRPR